MPRPPLTLLGLLVVVFWCAAAASQEASTTSPPSSAWGGYQLSEQVPYQPTLQPSFQNPMPQSVSAPWQMYPVPSPATTPIVTIPAPDSMAFPQPAVGPSGMKPWFPPGGRQGVFQKIKFTGDYLPRFSDDSLGMSDLQLDVVFGLPFLTVQTPLLITPFYAVHFLDGPDSPDVPPRLHEAAITFQNIRPINDNWLVMLDVTVGQYADDANVDSSEAFRITGGGAGIYRSSDRLKWVFGATYVDRINTTVLPIAGIIYTPNDDAEYRLVFPAPKLAWRLPWTEVPGLDERWAYVGGEFGGGKWAVRQADGSVDKLDITDWRVFIGYERKITGGLSRHAELGYVFLRKLEYQDVGDEIDLGNTLMVRGGLTY